MTSRPTQHRQQLPGGPNTLVDLPRVHTAAASVRSRLQQSARRLRAEVAPGCDARGCARRLPQLPETMSVRRFRRGPASRCSSPRTDAARLREPLQPGWHADHVARSAPAADGARERQALCPALQPREGRAAGVIAPRPGRPSSSRARRAPRPDFLLVATPGAGKTLAACQALRAAGREQSWSCARRRPCARNGPMRRTASGCTSTRAGATPTAPGAPTSTASS